jgi:biopolymer transport protein ExbD
MSISLGSGEDEDVIMSQINTTPLVDVMMVLLIIFLITIPVATTSIPVSLPKQRVQERVAKPENVIISVDKAGHIFWHATALASMQALVDRLKAVSVTQPQPEVQINGDLAARYESVGQIMAACQRAGITKVSFITEPPAPGG